MRSRALVLVLALGGLAVTAAGVDARAGAPPSTTAALVRLPADAPAPGPAVRTREQLDRDSTPTRPQVLAILATLAVVAVMAGWIVVRRRAVHGLARTSADARPRAPPGLFAPIPSS